MDQVRADAAYDEAKRSLENRGFLSPLLYSPVSMTIIDGAHRLVAALDLGLQVVPVVALTEAEAHLWWAATLLNKELGRTGATAAQESIARLADLGQLTGVGHGPGEQRPFVFEETGAGQGDNLMLAHRKTLSMTWEAPASCNMPAPCPYCGNHFHRLDKPALSRPAGEWLAAFEWMETMHSPFYITVCYGEPLSDAGCLEVISHLSEGNKVALYTNLVAHPGQLGIARPANVHLHASFHPHYWGGVAPFLAQAEAYRGRGFQVSNAVVVAFPPLLPDLSVWVDQLGSAGFSVTVNAFNGTHDGREYPQSYSDEEARLVGCDRADCSGMPSCQSKYCAAGCDTIFIRHDGKILQCYMADALVIGDVFDRRLELLPEWTACSRPYCPCPAPFELR